MIHTKWFTQTGTVEPTMAETKYFWNSGLLSGARLLRTFVWADFWGRCDGLAAPFGRCVPAFVGFMQSRLNDSTMDQISVHDGDEDWAMWQMVAFDHRWTELDGDTWSSFFKGWGTWDLGTQRTAIDDYPRAGIYLHTEVLADPQTDLLAQPSYSCVWGVRSLWQWQS